MPIGVRASDSLRAFGSGRSISIALLASLAWGCSAFEGLKLAPDASTVSPCVNHAGVPPRPSLASSPADEQTFFAALTELDFGDEGAEGNPSWPRTGFDLDGYCTGQGDGPSCVTPGWAVGDHTDVLDGRDNDGLDGRDNAFGALASDGRAFSTVSVSGTSNAEMKSGKSSLGIRVSRYNGLDNDDRVRVEVFGIRLSGEGTPKADGTDEWDPMFYYVDTDAGYPAPAKYFDDAAYVSDRKLVANFREMQGGGMILLRRVLLTARIVEADGGAWSLADGTFGGRASIDDLLALAEYVPDSKVCSGTREYAVYKPFVCRYADIRYSSPDDPSMQDDPTLPCDGVSMGWSFKAKPAHISDRVNAERARNYCEEANFPPIRDTCSSLPDPQNAAR